MKYGEAWATVTAASITPALENSADAAHMAAGPGTESGLDLFTNNWESAWIDIGGEG
jgi:hypothetical protein